MVGKTITDFRSASSSGLEKKVRGDNGGGAPDERLPPLRLFEGGTLPATATGGLFGSLMTLPRSASQQNGAEPSSDSEEEDSNVVVHSPREC